MGRWNAKPTGLFLTYLKKQTAELQYCPPDNSWVHRSETQNKRSSSGDQLETTARGHNVLFKPKETQMGNQPSVKGVLDGFMGSWASRQAFWTICLPLEAAVP